MIVWSRTLRDPTGHRFRARAWTTPSDLARPAYGAVTLEIQAVPPAGATYALTVCAADFSEAWAVRFFDAWLAAPAFREQFRHEPTPPGPLHPPVTVVLPDGPTAIDVAIAPAIVRLNAAGALTAACCQGGSGAVPYILLKGGAFPPELVAAWQGAGYDVSPRGVYAHPPWGLEAAAARHFHQSLQDWMAGTLDRTGARYRITEPRPSSLPALPPLPDRAPSTAQAVQHLLRLGPRATFRDFAALRSGRDPFSRLPLDALRQRVPEATAAAVAQALPDLKDQAAALRWVLRGLPVPLAVRKVQVDAEVRRNASRNSPHPANPRHRLPDVDPS